MKLLYIQNKFGLGGINRITAVKEGYWASHGYEVHNLNAQHEDCVPPEGMYDGRIHMYYIKNDQLNALAAVPVIGHLLRFVYYRYQLLRVICKVNPDVIISTMPRLEPPLVVWLTFWKKRVLEYHGWYNSPATTFITFRERVYHRLIAPFCQLVSLTKGEADKLKILTGSSAYYIPNPQYSFPKLISSCENKRVLSIARFSPQKKLEAVIPYWKKVEERHPDWELHLFGEGEDEPKMRRAIVENQLQRVFIHPYTTQVEEEMAKASIYIFPSMFEGFGLVLIEAMSAGVPCVSYDCPFGPAEIIRDGEDGFLTEYANPEAMIDKVLLLIENEELRKQMGRKARENSLTAFNIDEIMNQWKNLFETKL